jgi:UDP-N-acetylmuramoylalanine--D-glutamate ligase
MELGTALRINSQFTMERGARRLEGARWRGRRVTVIGLGTHGGGLGAVRFLAKNGARIRLTDQSSSTLLSQSLKELRDVRFESVRLGWHDASDFLDAEAVVVNPAVPVGHPLVQSLRRRQVPILTEVGLLWQHTSARVAAVTGSAGKSTTATMMDTILRKSGRRAWLGGNIGGSLLHDVESIRKDDWLVLELSSFQLAYLSDLGFRPDVGVITNISPNHLDWHGSFAEYRSSKQQMFAHQLPSDVAVLNSEDADVMNWPVRSSVVTFCDRQAPIAMDWSRLPRLAAGPLRKNAACAAAACAAMGIAKDAIVAGLSEFAPLPHRCETLGMHAGRVWINDSKATCPAAAEAAIAAYDRPWVLLGGADKQIDMSGFCESIASRISGAALLGEMSAELHKLLQRCNDCIPLRRCETLKDAVQWLSAISRPGDAILLSPACASLDQFRDYADRGEQFREAVLRLDSSPAIAPAA